MAEVTENLFAPLLSPRSSVAFVALVLLFLAGAVDYHALRERIKYQVGKPCPAQ